MRAKKGFKRLITLVLVLCMTLALGLPALASGTQDRLGNTAVEADKTGVLQVVTGVKDKETGKFVPVQAGTGFLVNEQNLVTCSHVANFDFSDEEINKYITEELGLTEKQANERKEIQISVYRDQVINASLVTKSDIADLAVLKLEQPLQNRTYLKINTAEVMPTAPCYTLGFPGLVGLIIDKNTYTSDDVTVNFGMINRMGNEGTVNSIVHTAQMPSGCSGGPLVDYEGSVIGITQKVHSEDGKQVNYMTAVAVSELVSMMEPLGIEFTKVETAVEPVDPVTVDKTGLQNALTKAATPPAEGTEEALVTELRDATAEAQTVMAKQDATQDEVNAATERLNKAVKAVEQKETQESAVEESKDSEKTGLPLPAIIAIIVAVVILIIVIVLLKPGSKPEPPTYGPGPDMPFGPAATASSGGASFGPAGGYDYAGKPETGTTVLSGGAMDTTVLGGENNATTVLSGGNYGFLTRTRTNERIAITKDQFKIGRERSRVDYCISDNPAVGRLHAIIVSRNGRTCVIDQNSTNSTFVNSVRANANQEVSLTNGDKITFADEEYTFNAF